MDSEFGRLGERILEELDRVAHYKLLAPNEVIYLQEDPAKFLYFVRSGHVRLSYLLEDGSAVLFGVAASGQSFGELGVFESGENYDMATSIGASSVYCIAAATFGLLARRHPDLAVCLGRTVAERFRSYVSLTRIFGLKTLNARLSQCLLRVADGLNDRVNIGDRDVLRVAGFITQSDLGLMARGARGNVNRALKAWERDGLVALQGRSILILNRAGLEAIAFNEEL